MDPKISLLHQNVSKMTLFLFATHQISPYWAHTTDPINNTSTANTSTITITITPAATRLSLLLLVM